jgi:glycogen(starch) synthase
VRILIATDSFPPNCGGSGWSTFELARGLRARGHDVLVVQPRVGRRSASSRDYEAFTVREIPVVAPDVPFVRNYFKNERFYRQVAPVLQEIIAEARIDLVHAQHVLTTPPSVAAGRASRVPVVATVRDYWPVCYWSDLIFDRSSDELCPACTPGMMTRCVRPRAPHAWPFALPLIPYMRANLARKRRALAGADAVIAVSSTIEQDLRRRAPELADATIVRIPNPVDCDAVVAQAEAGPAPVQGPYAIYAGKLAPNKGVSKLIPAVALARLPWPLIVVGDGPDREAVEQTARAMGQDVRFTGWLRRDEVLRWLRHASLVVFPSHGPESLSRVLLEASVLGRPIAAMDTGGTRDIVLHEETGLLSKTVDELASHIARLVAEPDVAAAFGAAARQHVREHFDAPRVVERIDTLYMRLLETPSRGGAATRA